MGWVAKSQGQKKPAKSRLDFVILILNYQTGHVPCEHNISVIIEFTLAY
jgi:hypothetical protein